MDKELIDYIMTHYANLLDLREKLVERHYMATLMAENLGDADSPLKRTILRHWGTTDKELLGLLDNGYEEFRRVSVEKILREHKDSVFINNCPKCGRLARTPLAKQCRYCSYSWRNL